MVAKSTWNAVTYATFLDISRLVLEDLPLQNDNPKFVFHHKDGGVDAVVLDVETANNEPIIIGVRNGKITTIFAKRMIPTVN
ncbi:MAG: hypothetical protein HRT92_03185 [Piscirickettsiaceae bacterium]|nr:hypothetical protein [Piscirickettsiaceae bacterium]